MINESGEFSNLSILRVGGFFGSIPPVYTKIDTTISATIPFFIADRNYEVLKVTERHLVAAAGDNTVSVYRVPSGTAPASGTSVQTTGMLLNTTANTNQEATLGANSARLIKRGDSLSLIISGTLDALSGSTIAVFLKAI